MVSDILCRFGLEPERFTVRRITAGHINFTYQLSGEKSYVLQRINKDIFSQPEIIARNLMRAADHLKQHAPGYRFLSSLPAPDGSVLIYDETGFPWRLFPYIPGTITVNEVQSAEEAFRAAAGFGELSSGLWHADVSLFKETIPRFHDLSLRFEQFEAALAKSTAERKLKARQAIQDALSNKHIVDEYVSLIRSGELARHVMHNDTKINNILFDEKTRGVVCVIDLDTLMPGYFINDLGDMIRTFVSPVGEEEKDYSKIVFRKKIYEALIDGYFSVMGSCLSHSQRALAPYSGFMMTYMMAIRFLADFLNGDVYYQTHYEGQNLVRAENQLCLLSVLQRSF